MRGVEQLRFNNRNPQEVDSWLQRLNSNDSLANAQYINVSVNNLVSVPPLILSCVQLTHVTLSFNSLVTVPREIGTALRNLEVLALHGNVIAALPDTLQLLSRLSFLTLKHNPPLPQHIAVDVLTREETQQHLALMSGFFTRAPREAVQLFALSWKHEGPALIHSLPCEIAVRISNLIWSSRNDPCWLQANLSFL